MNTDLTEAVEAACRAHVPAHYSRMGWHGIPEWEHLTDGQQRGIREYVETIVAAAVPIVVEQIAQAVEGEAKRDISCWTNLTGRAAAEDSYETAIRTIRKWAAR
jgi:hypothetical protein